MIESRSEKKEDGLRGFEKKSAALSSVLTSLTDRLFFVGEASLRLVVQVDEDEVKLSD